MQIQINPGDVPSSTAIETHVEKEVEKALEHFTDRVTRVEVHLHDANRQKGGIDKRCVMEARLAGLQPLAVEDEAIDLYDAITAAAGKLERAVRHKLERHQPRRP